MKYYQHHIRDFNNATRYLTRVERSLYRDLIEIYYDTEMPLTSELEQLEKIAMARSSDEIGALKAVLKDFFILEDDGYHNFRCDEIIEKYHSNSKAKSKAGKASAAKRKQKAAKRKQKVTSDKQNSTGVEQVSNEIQLTNNSKLITNNHKDLVGQETQEKILSELNLQAGKNFRALDANLKFIKARLNQGYSPDDLIAVITLKTREWKNDPKHFKYLRPATLFNDTKFNQYIGEVGVIVPTENQYGNRQTSSCERATKAREEYDKEQFERNQLNIEGLGEV